MVLSSVFYFFFGVLFYHIFHTFTIYGVEILGKEIPALLLHGIRLIAILIIFGINYKQWKDYFKKWKRGRISAGILSIFAIFISYTLEGKTGIEIITGYKYCFQWILIFLSFTMIGFFYQDKFHSQSFIVWIKYLLAITVILGFFRQIGKIINPAFFEWLGYTQNLDIYQYGIKPSIYYLTEEAGTMRRQGLFAGPNNYGYFLIGFFPLALLIFGIDWKKRKPLNLQKGVNLTLLLIWVLAMIFTLSRAVVIGGLIAIIGVMGNFLRKKKKILISLIIGGIIVLGGLSIWKYDSTKEHFEKTFSSLSNVIDQPLGYGLGESGPSYHHTGKFLPENYYIQILLDIGTIGFLIRMFFMFQILRINIKIKKEAMKKDENSEEILHFILLKRLQIGFFALLVIGFFLHVFEDSMVNYLFFGMYGILTGKLSHLIKGEVTCCNPFSLKTLKEFNEKKGK